MLSRGCVNRSQRDRESGEWNLGVKSTSSFRVHRWVAMTEGWRRGGTPRRQNLVHHAGQSLGERLL